MLSTALWLEAALRANLQYGQRRRFRHECGPGAVVLVSKDHAGLHAYCFRCDDSRLIPQKPTLTTVALSLRARAADEFSWRCELPSDFTLDIPAEHAVWLYKGSIRKEQARKYKIGWSAKLHRIIMPVFRGERLMYCQARAVDFPRQTPKYLNSRGAESSAVIFMADESPLNPDVLVCTEDMLSAIRCGKFCHAAACTGVKVSDALLLEFKRFKTIVLWFDPDSAGVSGMRKMKKLAMLYHDDVRLVSSNKDPKLLSDREINVKLQEVLCKTSSN